MVNGVYLEEFRNLRSEIISLKKDVNRVLERSSHQQMDAVFMEMKGDISRPFLNYMLEDTKETINERFCTECDKKDPCKSAFSDLLHEMALLLLEDQVTEDAMDHFRERFDELKGFAVTDNCDGCVASASRIFHKQMDLIRSFSMSKEDLRTGNDLNIADISDGVVTDVCEPLANKQRLAIMRSLHSDTRSFSELSKITGLRGGNLLFHIQKLLDTGMILQRTERGDYMITKKGHLTLKGMAELYAKLNDPHSSDVLRS
ncbi:winged helix-turn-helix domain-containing protein [Methanolobus profundi]|uniref:Helix-turn-helix domain-containing protein n=1 Tax=Methanolobus profundi TaxID=487685 RepID=A0A1I4PM94_9EURY|nr:winged helix-turn-helix domain-containing protein [Methanolobus profundi]SFM28583.1 Helix-turn-helix domain-containing protein [Methanolobus profundi]